jgi:nucleotide-binding universal stress UspA family protein
MTSVLSTVDAHATDVRVVEVAARLAEVLGADLDILHVRESADDEDAVVERFGGRTVRCEAGDPSARIVEAASHRDVEVIVVGARNVADKSRPLGHIARNVLEHADRPVVVVPPADGDRPFDLRRVLLPLEGSEPSSSSVAAVAARLEEGGVDIIPIHVFDMVTAPSFWDHAGHASDSYAASFAERWSPTPAIVRLRRGAAGPTIVDVAREEDVDLIVLGWSQRLSAGRAEVVRTALRDAGVSVLLVPSLAASPGV